MHDSPQAAPSTTRPESQPRRPSVSRVLRHQESARSQDAAAPPTLELLGARASPLPPMQPLPATPASQAPCRQRRHPQQAAPAVRRRVVFDSGAVCSEAVPTEQPSHPLSRCGENRCGHRRSGGRSPRLQLGRAPRAWWRRAHPRSFERRRRRRQCRAAPTARPRQVSLPRIWRRCSARSPRSSITGRRRVTTSRLRTEHRRCFDEVASPRASAPMQSAS